VCLPPAAVPLPACCRCLVTKKIFNKKCGKYSFYNQYPMLHLLTLKLS
jgi:hypothetical protein